MRHFIIFLSIALLGNAGAQTFELYDDFSGSVLDTQKWETWYWPGGSEPSVNSGKLNLINSGGTAKKALSLESELAAAGLDFTSATYHSGVLFTDPSIIGVEAELYLPVGTPLNSGVLIDFFEKVSSTEVRSAGVELGYWDDDLGGGQPELWYNKTSNSNGSENILETTQYNVSLGQSYLVRVLRQDGQIKLYRDDTLVVTHPAEGEIMGIILVAFNEDGQAMTATVDNVRVLRDTPQEARWEPAGWVYYAWPYAYDSTQGRWHFFNQSDKQWRVNLSDSEWATLDAATGWNYYAWPYSYSSDQSTWHWYDANTQWVVDLASEDWELFGGSD